MHQRRIGDFDIPDAETVGFVVKGTLVLPMHGHVVTALA